MAVPKKRTGKSAQGKRRANWKATVPAVTTCTSCGAAVPTHTVCPECGSYKGKAVSNKNAEAAAEAVKEEKPKTKKAAKEVKETVEEVKTEENKTKE